VLLLLDIRLKATGFAANGQLQIKAGLSSQHGRQLTHPAWVIMQQDEVQQDEGVMPS